MNIIQPIFNSFDFSLVHFFGLKQRNEQVFIKEINFNF